MGAPAADKRYKVVRRLDLDMELIPVVGDYLSE